MSNDTFDKGFITKATQVLINKSQYNTSLETMEIINENDDIVSIEPYNSESKHLVLLSEFIRMNINSREFKNPYTRNCVFFNNEDLFVIKKLKKELLQALKTVPHEIFMKFLDILFIINNNNLQIVYFSDICKIFQVLLGAIPFFETLEEIDNNENISELIKNIENQLDTTINVFKNELENEESILKMKETINFISIPNDIKDSINYMFCELLNILQTLGEEQREFDYKKDILNILIVLDDIQYILSINNIPDEEFQIKLYCILCDIYDKINSLKESI